MTWTRSDAIAAGSLAVAFLALIYGPAKDLYQTANTPTAHMAITKECVQVGVEGTAEPPALLPNPTLSPSSSPASGSLKSQPHPSPVTQSLGAPTDSCNTGTTRSPDPGSSSSSETNVDSSLRSIDIYGTSENIPPDKDLWVVVRHEDDGKFYPLGLARKLADGAWNISKSVEFAMPQTTYTIILYMADSVASQQLRAWDTRETKKPKNQYDGMPSTPPDLTVLDSESFTRGQ